MDDIKIYELKRLDMRGATVIDGFPSVGLVSTITANYLITALNMEQIGILDSKHFPTVSVIRNGEPLNPVRLYANERNPEGEDGTQLVVFISEFQPPPNLIKMIASTILDWMQEQNCKLLISPEGLLIDRVGDKNASDTNQAPNPDTSTNTGDVVEPPHLEETDDNDKRILEEGLKASSSDEEEDEYEPLAYGIGSTPTARELLKTHNIAQFNEGVISGVAGVLMNEGKRRAVDVISILAEARPDYPDARAAAVVIDAIDKILLHLDIDVEPLYREAEAIEHRIKSMQIHAKSQPKKAIPIPQMYG